MRVGIYPGTFDPLTLGHIDIIKRSAKMVDKLVIAVLSNASKTPMFTLDERMEIIRKAMAHMENVEIQQFHGLLIDYAKKLNANVVFRGLRGVMDFEYELQMAQTNRCMSEELDTIFLATNVNYAFISSTLVKEVIRHDGPVEKLIPAEIVDDVKAKIKEFKA